MNKMSTLQRYALFEVVILSGAKDLSKDANLTTRSWCNQEPNVRFLIPTAGFGMTRVSGL
jgi:hypothetical protein